MSPRTPTPDPGEPVDPAEDRVRRLLADARHTGPVPPDVAARLDDVLADLGAGREPGTSDGRDPVPVVDLARRRRRRAAALLAAAVVVVAGGLTTDALRDPGTGDAADSGGGSASSARTDPADPTDPTDPTEAPGRATEREGLDQGGSQDDGSAAAPEALDQDDGDGATTRVRPKVVRADAFVRDVRRLRSAPGTPVRSASRVVGEEALGAGPGFVCGPPTAYGAGRLVPVRYRGGAAVLAYRVPAGATQTVDLLQCGTAQVLRSTTLPRS